jgi:copper chaperone CopZ
MTDGIIESIIRVDGMHCHGCEGLIEDILLDEKGVESARVSHRKGTVDVEYNPSVISLDRIKELISSQDGYKVVDEPTKYF